MADILYRVYANENYIVLLLAAEALFCFSLPRRRHFLPRALIAAAVCLTAGWFVMDNLFAIVAVVRYFPLVFLALFAVSVGAALLCFKGSAANMFFCIFGAYFVQNTANNLHQIVLELVPADRRLEVLLLLAVYGAVYAACYFLFAKKLYDGDCVNIDNGTIICIGGVIAVSCFFLYMYAVNSALPVSVRIAFRISLILTCFITLAFQFGLLSKGRLAREREMLERLLLEKKLQYEIVSENLDAINIRCHDLRHYVMAVRSGESDAALGEIEKNIAVYDAVARTGNRALDVVLTEKNLVCERENIRLNIICDGEKLAFMPAYEIYALFGNILDNAIEAVRALPDADMRVIRLKLAAQGGMLCVHQQNYTPRPLSLVGGLPQTTKPDKDLHGYGVKSIDRIVKKYGGVMTLGADAEIFTLNILLPL